MRGADYWPTGAVGDTLGGMQTTRVRTAAALIALTALLCAVAIASREPVRATIGGETQKRRAEPAATPASRNSLDDAAPPVVTYDSGERSATPGWQWWALATLALTGVVSASVLLVPELRRWARARRERRTVLAARGPTVGEATGADEPPDEADVLQRAIDAASAPLRDPAEPRAAVIEAYARMEQVLAERELGRRAPEAPREYLARVLHERGAPQQSLATITSLFEEARYSHHPISPSAPRARRARAGTYGAGRHTIPPPGIEPGTFGIRGLPWKADHDHEIPSTRRPRRRVAARGAGSHWPLRLHAFVCRLRHRRARRRSAGTARS
jgi:hypothetical protein